MYKYQIDPNIQLLSQKIEENTLRLRPDYLKIDGLAHEIIKYCKQGMKNNKRHNKLVHRLVAEAFINNPENYAVVNHIDGNKQNNNVSNLEWCSASYNIKHAYLTGLNKKIKAVIQVDLTGKIIRKYNSVRETKQYGYQSSGVSEACNGLKTNHIYRGFIWRFDNAI